MTASSEEIASSGRSASLIRLKPRFRKAALSFTKNNRLSQKVILHDLLRQPVFHLFNLQFRFAIEKMRLVHVESHVDGFASFNIKAGIHSRHKFLLIHPGIEDNF